MGGRQVSGIEQSYKARQVMNVLELHEDERALSIAGFRCAMRHLAAGVGVITVGRDKDISGMTVTSVSSLSIEPA